jgi:hypothetical protein
MGNRNPYLDDHGKPIFHQSVVAFIDVLGYEDMVLASEAAGHNYDFLVHLRNTLTNAIQYLDEDRGEKILILHPKLFKKDLYRIRIFTDNIVIGYPVRDDAESELGRVFSLLAYFQLEMVMHGFFLRGAIAVGDLFMDDIVVFGKGLIEAYRGERDKARDPRIILTDSATKAVEKHLKYYASPSHSPQARDLYIDADGQYFLNYLDTILIAEDEHGPFYEELDKHKRAVETCLDKYRSRPAIWSKYAWAANYHNFFCDQSHYFSEEHRVDLSKYQMSPRRIEESTETEQ